MKRLAALTAVWLAALVLGATAFAAATTYTSAYRMPAGHAASTSYGSGWFWNVFSKTSSFDTTLTFIDNVSYSWHATVRSWALYVESRWLSSQVKKAHCRANTTGASWAACTAYN